MLNLASCRPTAALLHYRIDLRVLQAPMHQTGPMDVPINGNPIFQPDKDLAAGCHSLSAKMSLQKAARAVCNVDNVAEEESVQIQNTPFAFETDPRAPRVHRLHPTHIWKPLPPDACNEI